jgi:GNAT superfamily N-acetyltransferase
MRLERFDPAMDADPVRACHEIYLAAAPVDDPLGFVMSRPSFRGWLMFGWSEDPTEVWLARDAAGNPLGFVHLSLPERENRHAVYLSPQVHPAARRTGLGTLLVAHTAGCAREAGRTLLVGHSMSPVPGTRAGDPASASSGASAGAQESAAAGDPASGPAGEAFARAVGARHRLSEMQRVLRLGTVPAGHLAGLRERAGTAAQGYSLVSWAGLTPEDRVGQVAALYAAEADAPRGAGEEAPVWDAERTRQDDRRIATQGHRCYTVAARPEHGGDLAALTQLEVDPLQPAWGYQALTVVARPHRGHRLGLLVKLAMLDLLAEREPQLAQIVTGNADGNEHMIAINEALGYQPLSLEMSWELDVAQALQS